MQTAKSKTYRVSLVHIKYITYRILNWVDTMIEWYIPKSGIETEKKEETENMSQTQVESEIPKTPKVINKCSWCGKENATVETPHTEELVCRSQECVEQFINSRGISKEEFVAYHDKLSMENKGE